MNGEGGAGRGGAGFTSFHGANEIDVCTIPSIVDDVTVVLPSCSDTLVMTTINK